MRVWSCCVLILVLVLAPVENLKVWPEQGRLWVEWTAPSSGNASEYVVEWVSGEEADWQRESGGTTRTAIAGIVFR